MALLLLSLGVLLLGGLAALLACRSPRAASALGAGGAVLGGAIGLVPAVLVLIEGGSPSLRLPWSVPYGSFSLEADALSAFFLLPILGLSVLSAIYGHGYLASRRGEKNLGAHWFNFNLLVASMVLVVLARNGVLFLVAWEVMALASFFLVTFEDEKESVREAGWTYLVATHLGTAFLLAFFIVLGRQSGSLDFDRISAAGGVAPAAASAAFLLAVVGFGAKAGFIPFHVWLPEAHPAAPSHVSALMSGVMIKTGIYGIARALTFLGAPPAWWGWVLIALGLASGILGVLFALAQENLKRLLAYSSVENVGIIALGMGVGILGLAGGSSALATLGFAGALLHVVNHCLMKGLLFLGAGAVMHGSGTGEMNRLGGLLKVMPGTGAAFVLGASAICGLPPLNGFTSELLIFLGSFREVLSRDPAVAGPALAVIAGLALIGGLAAACFAKAVGIVFLGEPRSEEAARAHEVGKCLRLPQAALAAGCVLLGLLPVIAIAAVSPVLRGMGWAPPEEVDRALLAARTTLHLAALGSLGLLALAGALLLLRARLLSRRQVERAVTWDCGYARPSPRMQYTGSSFAQPLTDLFRNFLRTRSEVAPPGGFFPGPSSLSTRTPDVFHEGFYRALFSGIARGLARIRWLQHGRVQLYVLYIALTLLFLLLWKLD